MGQNNWISSQVLCCKKLIITSHASILFISDSFAQSADSIAKTFFVRFARDFARANIKKYYREHGRAANGRIRLI